MDIEQIDRPKPGTLGKVLMVDLKFQVVRSLCLQGAQKGTAIAIMNGLSEHWAQGFGGLSMYIPKSRAKKPNSLGIEQSKDEEVNPGNTKGSSHFIPRRIKIGDVFLDDTVNFVTKRLALNGFNVETATRVGLNVKEHLVHHFGGNEFYVPKLIHDSTIVRNKEIYTEYKGGASHYELSMKYQLSLRHIYEILKQIRNQTREDTKKRVTQNK